MGFPPIAFTIGSRDAKCCVRLDWLGGAVELLMPRRSPGSGTILSRMRESLFETTLFEMTDFEMMILEMTWFTRYSRSYGNLQVFFLTSD